MPSNRGKREQIDFSFLVAPNRIQRARPRQAWPTQGLCEADTVVGARDEFFGSDTS